MLAGFRAKRVEHDILLFLLLILSFPVSYNVCTNIHV